MYPLVMTNISPWWRHGGAMAPIEIDSIFPATETSIYGWDFPWLWINGTGVAGWKGPFQYTTLV